MRGGAVCWLGKSINMTINTIFKGGISLGIKNFLPLIGVVILYVLTCWIPYLNVGTTIALVALPAAMSRGESISPTEIFDSKYRKNMGNFFLLSVFYFFGIVIGVLFGIIPGIVLSFSWCIAFLLLVDKELNPMQALAESNQKTYGHKVTIFLSFLLLGILYFALSMIAGMISGGSGDWMANDIYGMTCNEILMYGDFEEYLECKSMVRLSSFSVVGTLMSVILFLLYMPIQLGFQAEIYRGLTTENSGASESE